MRRIRKLYTSRVLPLVYDYSLSVTEMVGKLVKAVNDMADDVTDNTDDIETLQSDVTTLQDQTQMALNGVENLGNRVENIEEELENVPTDERIGELQAAINQNSADIVVLDSRVDILESQPDLSSEVHNNTANIATLRSDVSDLESDVSTLQTDVSGVQSDLSTLSGTVNTLSGDVTSLFSDVSSLQSDVSTLQSDVGTLQTDVSSLQSDVGTLQTDVSALQTDVASKSEVSYNEIITTGSQIGTITIDGVSTDLYAPSATVIPPASGITYDNTTSGLQAGNVQDAIDEVNTVADSKSTVSVIDNMGTGNEIAKIYVDGSPTTIYSPVMSNAQYALVSEGNRAYLKLPNGVFAGVLTGSAKNIYFFIPLPYDFTNFHFQNQWRLSCPGTYIRGTSGNLVANEDLSTYSNSDSAPTATKRFTLTFTTGGILVLLTNDSGFGGTTNTPVTVYFGSNARLYDRPS